MQIQFISDVHMTHRSHLFPLVEINPGNDLVILGGDISTEPRDALAFVNHIRRHHKGPVIYIMGNHEYYGRVFDRGQEEFVDVFKGMNVEVVSDVYTLNYTSKIKVIAAPLWTGFDNGKAVLAALQGINDFVAIHEVSEDARLINVSPHTMMRENTKQFNSLFAQIRDAAYKKIDVVVATHFAPSWKSVAEKYRGSPLNGYFCNEYDAIMERYPVKYWLHGHTHSDVDYHVGDTHVLSTQIGYPWEEDGDMSVTITV